jgi:hypothetical protein
MRRNGSFYHEKHEMDTKGEWYGSEISESGCRGGSVTRPSSLPLGAPSTSSALYGGTRSVASVFSFSDLQPATCDL